MTTPGSLRDDAAAMDRSAALIKSRARKPGSFIVYVVCHVLTENARRLRAEADSTEEAAFKAAIYRRQGA